MSRSALGLYAETLSSMSLSRIIDKRWAKGKGQRAKGFGKAHSRFPPFAFCLLPSARILSYRQKKGGSPWLQPLCDRDQRLFRELSSKPIFPAAISRRDITTFLLPGRFSIRGFAPL